MTRMQVTEKIALVKVKKGLTWAQIAFADHSDARIARAIAAGRPEMSLERVHDPKGDRVKVVMNGARLSVPLPRSRSARRLRSARPARRRTVSTR
jgi:cyanate lyase